MTSSFLRAASLRGAQLFLLAVAITGCEEFTGPATSSGGGASSSSVGGASASSASLMTTTADSSSATGADCPGGCPAGANSTGACQNGACVYTCMQDFGDCDADPKTCETDLTTNDDCGQCDVACATTCAVIATTHQCNDPIAIAAGASHTCAVRRDGTVWCWGFNNFGQVGVGSNVPTQFVPAKVTLPFPAKAVDARHNSTCALGEGGEVACWGRDGNDFSTPLVYSQLTSVGQVSVAGLDPSDNGPGTSLYLDSVSGTARAFVVSNITEPGTSLILAAQTEVAAGGGHYCVRNLAGEVRCAGANGKSQLGLAPTTFESQLKLVPSLTAKAVALGSRHSCAIRNDGALLCWGDNASGQTGLMGSTVVQPTVVPIPGGASVDKIVLGDVNTAAIAGGSLYLWGGNANHQASPAADNPVFSPTAYPLSDVTDVAVGSSHTCALTKSGKMVCWGLNAAYQLGDGTMMPATTPVEPLWP